MFINGYVFLNSVFGVPEFLLFFKFIFGTPIFKCFHQKSIFSANIL